MEVIFDQAGKQEEIIRLEELSASPGFWDDAAEARRALKRLSDLKAAVEPFIKMKSQVQDLEELAELVEDEDSSDAAELRSELESVEAIYAQLELETLLSGEHDSASAILEINAGAGGTEACDWADMLLRVYLRWAERRG